MALLEIQGLSKHFGGLHVTADVDFTLDAGELHCLIGPNGAGKSTFFRLILGVVSPDRGKIVLAGKDITRLKPFQRVHEGMSVKFQVPGIFKTLSVSQNLQTALQHNCDADALAGKIAEMLDFLGLAAEARSPAGNLSHGQKQWLEIGMAVCLKPRLLLLDEPTAGMSPKETEATGELVKSLNAQGVTVLVVEHDMAFVRQVAQRVTVMHLGRIFAQGTVEEVMADSRVEAIYLGRSHA
ncbi:ABC transporter ATP-binding protein [Kaistia terrae]|uniref:ABC transporter ATP-binding protein n=1 Tax=Kaistia terrae TaxID=537017 RepID=A0ABW0PYQ9_9HYPH|nr:ABC transporter ATP-binding protein [Kaistia terrae]MCX5580878.1 ABC transporter ATP-binding protein [Kaistia terrae]